MSKRIAFGLSILVGLASYVACAPVNNGGKDGGPGGQDDAGGPGMDGGSTNGDASAQDGGGGDGASQDGSMVTLPTPVLCPEADPFHPTNPNSVLINDVVLQSDAHWTADKIYLIGDDFKIEGHTLTVDAGTTICLYQKGKIYVGQGIDPGEIHLNGTAQKPIVITAPPSTMDPTKPDVFHGGIQFDTYLGSTVSYVNVWYGGPGGGGASWALELTDTAHGSDPTKPLLLDHVTIGAVQSKGVRVGTELGVASGSAIQFTGFVPSDPSAPAVDAVAEVDVYAVPSFAKAFTFAGAPIPAAAKHASLLVPADEKLNKSADLVDFGLPFLYAGHLTLGVAGAQDDPVGATLTIHEGVTLQMSGALIVGGLSGTAEGNLVIAGTAAKPVVLTSAADTPAKGDWEGIYFVGGQFDPARSKIDNAQILYAGVDTSDPQNINHSVGRCGNFAVGAIMIDGSTTAPYQGPAITSTHVAHSASDGIVSAASMMGYLTTAYAKPDITFEDIAGGKNLWTGMCP